VDKGLGLFMPSRGHVMSITLAFYNARNSHEARLNSIVGNMEPLRYNGWAPEK
jgi:hypothetical protein